METEIKIKQLVQTKNSNQPDRLNEVLKDIEELTERLLKSLYMQLSIYREELDGDLTEWENIQEDTEEMLMIMKEYRDTLIKSECDTKSIKPTGGEG